MTFYLLHIVSMVAQILKAQALELTSCVCVCFCFHFIYVFLAPWVFTAAGRLSLIAASRGYSLVVVLLIGMASLGAWASVVACGALA